MESQQTVSIIKVNLPEKKLVTANSVLVYKFKDSLIYLQPFFYYIISHYKTEQAGTILGKESFILFQILQSCRHAHLQVKYSLRKTGCRDPHLRVWGTSVSSNIQSTHISLPEHTPHEPEV